jgi:hypothetical protein
MSDVAMALIATGQSKPEHVNDNGVTALMYAQRNNMTDIIMLLQHNNWHTRMRNLGIN